MKPLYYLVTAFSSQKAERNALLLLVTCVQEIFAFFAYVLKVIFTHLVLLGYRCLVFNMFTLEKEIA